MSDVLGALVGLGLGLILLLVAAFLGMIRVVNLDDPPPVSHSLVPALAGLFFVVASVLQMAGVMLP